MTKDSRSLDLMSVIAFVIIVAGITGGIISYFMRHP